MTSGVTLFPWVKDSVSYEQRWLDFKNMMEYKFNIQGLLTLFKEIVRLICIGTFFLKNFKNFVFTVFVSGFCSLYLLPIMIVLDYLNLSIICFVFIK